MKRKLWRWSKGLVLGPGAAMCLLVPVLGAAPSAALDRPRQGRFAIPGRTDGQIVFVSWNVARGAGLEEIVSFLRAESPDVCLLQEVDVAARRTGLLDIPAEIARRLGYDFVFGAEYREMAEGGGGAPALHGQATLSRYPIVSARILRYRSQSEFWRPRWYVPNWSALQRRQGGRMALRVAIDTGAGKVVVYNTHLESRGPESRRAEQLDEVLEDARSLPPSVLAVIAGDLNTRDRPSEVILRASGAGFESAIPDEPPTAAPRPRSLVRSLYAGLLLRFGEDRARLQRTLDWFLLRGPAADLSGEVRASAGGSDHYPLVVRLRLQTASLEPRSGAAAQPPGGHPAATRAARTMPRAIASTLSSRLK